MEGTSACQMSEPEDVKSRRRSPLFTFRDSESLRFLQGICSRVPSQRIHTLENVARVFDGWLEGYGSPHETVLIDCAAGENNVLPTDFKFMIREQLPDLLRFSINCPFADVRERCSNILQDLQVNVVYLWIYFSCSKKRHSVGLFYVPCLLHVCRILCSSLELPPQPLWLCGIFYFYWHRHQMEGANSLYHVYRNTQVKQEK